MVSTLRLLPAGLLLSALAYGQVPLGQGSQNGDTLASRCAGANARFNYSNGGFEMHGPSGIAIDPAGRFFVTDFGGRRVLTWPNFETLQYCQAADSVIGAGDLAGPEAVTFDPITGAIFVADTLNHTVKGYRHSSGRRSGFTGGTWVRFVTLGTSGVAGNSGSQFNFPRGLAMDPSGRLFVADDFNQRILIFRPPFASEQEASDSIGGFADGGFNGPKGLAMSGHTLFVADYYNNRVLRFTGPFDTPDQVYASSGSFTGLNQPVDIAVHPDGSLLVTDQGNLRIARYPDAVWTDSQTFPIITHDANLHREPLGIAADRNGRIFVADYTAYRVVIRNEQVTQTPITLFNSSSGAQVLLSDLHAYGGRTAGRVVIGQQLITWRYGARTDPNAWFGAFLKMEQNGLPLPRIMGGEVRDLMSYPGFFPNEAALNELIRHGREGGMVTLVWHPDNPTGGDFSTPISTAELRNMTDQGTQTGRNWQVQLERAAAVLRKFQAANVPVMFRPLHEQNGTFFWWGHDGATKADLRDRQAAWVGMWRDLVLEMNTRQGLSNLLFVFGTNQLNYDQVAPPLTYYPGGFWADAVSIDIYNDDLNLAGDDRGYQHYSALIGTGKPFGLAEFGQSFDRSTGPNGSSWDARTLVRRVNDSYPRTAFAIAWYSSVENGTRYVFALPDVSFTRELLGDSLIVTKAGNPKF